MNKNQLEEVKNEVVFWECFWKFGDTLYECKVALEYQTKLSKLKLALLPENIYFSFNEAFRTITAHISQTERSFHKLVVANRDRPLKEIVGKIENLEHREMLLKYLEKAGF